MKEELGKFYEPIDVVKMFKISTDLFKKYFPALDVVYSIEGCDYIKNVSQLEELYELGLRNVLLVWNNKKSVFRYTIIILNIIGHLTENQPSAGTPPSLSIFA